MTTHYGCKSTRHSEFTCYGYHLQVRHAKRKFPFTQWCDACRAAFPNQEGESA